MPSSRPDHIALVVYAIISAKPTSVLDIGCGHGKYGFLAREYGRWWCDCEPVVDAIEAHAPYIGDLQRAVYRDIHIGDALSVLPKLGTYDLAICSDVLEHFRDEDALAFLALVRDHSKSAIIAYPAGNNEQGAAFGNEYERHRSTWDYERLSALAPCTLLGEINGVQVVSVGGNV